MTANVQTITESRLTIVMTMAEADLLRKLLAEAHEVDYLGRDYQSIRLNVMAAIEEARN